MKDFRSTIRVTKAQLDQKGNSEGQTYFATDIGVFYRDYLNERLAITNVYKINTTNSATIPVTLSTKIRNSILIQNDSIDGYSLWYIDESGNPQSIGGSGGGSTYTAGDGLDLTGSSFSVDIEAGKGLKFTDVASPNKELTVDDLQVLFKESADWIIDNGTDFKIIQNNSPDPNEEIIVIYNTQDPNAPNPKVRINAKTTISDLDFGAW